MEAHLQLAEHATIHPDNTVTIVRAGLTRLHAKNPPVRLRAAIVVSIASDPPDEGEHTFELQLRGQDGEKVGPNLKGEIELPGEDDPGIFYFVAPCQAEFKKPGDYVFYLRINKAVHDSWKIRVAFGETNDD